MKITESVEKLDELVQLMAEREFSTRDEKFHQSDGVYCLNKAALRRWSPRKATLADVMRHSRGYATQRWLTGKPDELPIEVDGIVVTLDATWPSDPNLPWELKNTDQSSTKPIGLHWLRQLMAQAYVKHINKVALTRWANMGNWKWVWNRKPTPEKLAELVEQYGENWADHPILQVYDIEFTEVELKANWEWLKRRKRLFDRMMEEHALLPRGFALPNKPDTEDPEEWECKDCPYNGNECPLEEKNET